MNSSTLLPTLAALTLASAASLAAAPEILSVRQTLTPQMYERARTEMLPETFADRSVEVKRYEKLELRIDLRAIYQNPYDPDDIDLWAEFTAPSGKVWKIWGFYNPSNWSSLWMVRFAPDETGTWRVVAKVRDREGTAQSKPREITVLPSDHHGFIRLAANKRYFRYDDGTPFYGVGLWHNDGYELFGRGQITDVPRQVAAAQLFERGVVQHLAQAAAHRHPQHGQVLRHPVVLRLVRTPSAHLGQRTVHRPEDRPDGDLGRGPGQLVATAGPFGADHQFGAAQVGQNGLQKLARQSLTLREHVHRNRRRPGV